MKTAALKATPERTLIESDTRESLINEINSLKMELNRSLRSNETQKEQIKTLNKCTNVMQDVIDMMQGTPGYILHHETIRRLMVTEDARHYLATPLLN